MSKKENTEKKVFGRSVPAATLPGAGIKKDIASIKIAIHSRKKSMERYKNDLLALNKKLKMMEKALKSLEAIDNPVDVEVDVDSNWENK